MQAAKDSVFVTLCERLAALSPSLMVTIGGVQRSPVAVVENERMELGDAREGVFWLRWGGCRPLFAEHALVLNEMDLTIEYGSRGTAADNGSDRGRTVAAMDEYLASILQPQSAAVMDYTQTPPVALGNKVIWGQPVFEALVQEGTVLWRKAAVKVYFHPEAE